MMYHGVEAQALQLQRVDDLQREQHRVREEVLPEHVVHHLVDHVAGVALCLLTAVTFWSYSVSPAFASFIAIVSRDILYF